MLKYILKRLLWIIPVLLGVTIIVFTLLYFTPGDPALQVLGANSTEEARQMWREERGLNNPYFVQLASYCKKVFLEFDFGRSYSGNRIIADEIRTRLPNSVKIAFLMILFDMLVGIPIGIISAVKKYSILDNILMVFAIILVSMPSFWIAMELSIVFALKLQWLPPSGLYGPKYYILPVASIALGGIATAARMVRSSMLDSLTQDYTVTAKAKGASSFSVIINHAFRNSLLPTITQIGAAAAIMISGAMITEVVYSIPGMGNYLITGINARDYPVVLGVVIVLSFISCIILLITDLIYALVDPRMKAQFETGKKPKKVKEV